ncbi:MAG: hypothetical protein HZC18_01590 [Candidatus Omnitrophica bacterium]|nr:hypothetical protein [Candidatus Omnitrophota bacterium]
MSLRNTPATPMGRKVYAHLWRVSNLQINRLIELGNQILLMVLDGS